MATTAHHDRLLSFVYWFRNRKVSEAVAFCVTLFDGASEKRGEAINNRSWKAVLRTSEGTPARRRLPVALHCGGSIQL